MNMQNIEFTRFCDDPELVCCKAEKDYLRLKIQEYKLQTENISLYKVITVAKGVCRECSITNECTSSDCWIWPIKQAIAELDRS